MTFCENLFILYAVKRRNLFTLRATLFIILRSIPRRNLLPLRGPLYQSNRKEFCMKFIKYLLITCLFYTAYPFADENSDRGSVVVMYHRFDGKYPSTSVTAQMLEQHIQYFKSNGFKIITLRQLVSNIRNRRGLKQKTAVITIDDAFVSTYTIAHPIFKKHKIPYTLFINTESVEQKNRSYMSWAQIKEVANSGLATLEAHSHTHGHLIRTLDAKGRKQDVLKSVSLIHKRTGKIPRIFAYPYGETSLDFKQKLSSYNWTIDGRNYNIIAALTTQSGPAGYSSDLYAIPRFALNLNYGSLDARFKNKMNSRHFPVKSFSPDPYALCSKTHPTSFTLKSTRSLKNLNCFVSSAAKLRLEKTEADNKTVKIHLSQPFTKSLSSKDKRERINCTLPAGNGEFFWLGKEFAVLNCKNK